MRTDSFVDPAHPSMALTKSNGGTFSAVTLAVFKVGARF